MFVFVHPTTLASSDAQKGEEEEDDPCSQSGSQAGNAQQQQ
jgi:hypothetical protein